MSKLKVKPENFIPNFIRKFLVKSEVKFKISEVKPELITGCKSEHFIPKITYRKFLLEIKQCIIIDQ